MEHTEAASSEPKDEASKPAKSLAYISRRFAHLYGNIPYARQVDDPAPPYEGQPVAAQPVVVTQPVSQPAPPGSPSSQPLDDNWCFPSWCLAIFVTLCCCWPLGIVAIVFSSLACKARGENRIEDAKKHGRISFMLSMVALAIGIILIITIIVLRVYVNSNDDQKTTSGGGYRRRWNWDK